MLAPLKSRRCPVKGARDYKDGKASLIKGLELLDDYTVRITLDSPDAIFLLSLSEPSCVILPEHLLRNAPPDDGVFGT